MRARLAALLGCIALVAAACGSGGGGSPSVPTVAPAKQYKLDWQAPVGVAKPGEVTLKFAIVQPDGSVLTQFRRGAGPHTGVHVIVVRDDLTEIVHKHPPVPANGQFSLPVELPTAGRYHVLVDIYPAAATGGPPNFQLTHDLQVGTGNVKLPLPAYSPVVHAGGLTFRVTKRPNLHLAEPASMVLDVTDAAGKPVKFTPFYGALAHAIFFRNGTLDYFHSHICGNDPACSAGFGTAATTGHSTKPGQLELGVLLPATGKWRLFLQVTHDGKLLTAPFTLVVR